MPDSTLKYVPPHPGETLSALRTEGRFTHRHRLCIATWIDLFGITHVRERVGAVPADGVDHHVLTFEAGRQAVIGLVGEADLGLFVYDQSGRVVALDDDPTARCLVAWVPQRTGPYRLEVLNLNLGAVPYRLIHNGR